VTTRGMIAQLQPGTLCMQEVKMMSCRKHGCLFLSTVMMVSPAAAVAAVIHHSDWAAHVQRGRRCLSKPLTPTITSLR
jgi:hypothetical protein